MFLLVFREKNTPFWNIVWRLSSIFWSRGIQKHFPSFDRFFSTNYKPTRPHVPPRRRRHLRKSPCPPSLPKYIGWIYTKAAITRSTTRPITTPPAEFTRDAATNGISASRKMSWRTMILESRCRFGWEFQAETTPQKSKAAGSSWKRRRRRKRSLKPKTASMTAFSIGASFDANNLQNPQTYPSVEHSLQIMNVSSVFCTFPSTRQLAFTPSTSKFGASIQPKGIPALSTSSRQDAMFYSILGIEVGSI